MRPLILIFTFMYAFILSAQSSGGFTFRPRNLSIQKKGGLAKAGKTKPDNPAPAEVRFLTLRITTDLDGKIYLSGGKTEEFSVKNGIPLDLPVFRESAELIFVGPDNYQYKETFKFTPDQRGSTAERIISLSKLYRIYLQKQAEKSEQELILDGIFQNMQTIEPDEGVLPAFEIGRFEITLEQFSLFAQDDKYKRDNNALDSALIIFLPSGNRGFQVGVDWRHDASGRIRPYSEYNHPVANVSWIEANAFCDWLSEKDPVYRYRLPNASEWEYVAGCGDYYFLYPWGYDPIQDPADSLSANTADPALRVRIPKGKMPISGEDDGYAFTSPVGSFYSPCFDIYDLGGNVAEWMQDDITREIEGHHFMEKQIKGGSFFSPSNSIEVKSRKSNPPNLRHCGIGFRVVREPK